MGHVVLVQIVERFDNLQEQVDGFLFSNAMVLDNVLEHFPAINVLHDQEDGLRSVDHLVQLYKHTPTAITFVSLPRSACCRWTLYLDDVGMEIALEDLDFPRHALRVGDLKDAALLQDLDGYLFARREVHADLDFAKCA